MAGTVTKATTPNQSTPKVSHKYRVSLCVDCGLDTKPCSHRPGCRHAGRWEYYMLCGPVWTAAGAPEGDLCVGCVEARLGRPLVPADFAVVSVNEPHPWQSGRLVSRMVGVSEEALVGRWRR
jgi:hypothetical protein